VQHTDMSMALLENKMRMVESTGADLIVTANPGCMLQLEAGGRMFSKGQQVMHVIELLDDAYRRAEG
jgi:glycolate oxidase iron-sulfur subunit